jgi:hypothetical protein
MAKKYTITLEMEESFDFNEKIILNILKSVPNGIIVSMNSHIVAGCRRSSKFV